jgi:hypothetical protein
MNDSYSDHNGHITFSDNGAFDDVGFPNFAFKSVPSLKLLLELWRQYEADKNPDRAALARKINAALKNAPELAEPLGDFGAIARHAPLVEQLMSAVFPSAYAEELLGSASTPFQFQPFFATPGFKQLAPFLRGDIHQGLQMSPEQHRLTMTLNAYANILKRFYNVDPEFDSPIIFTGPDPQTGLDRHFKISIDLRFVEIKCAGALPALTPDDVRLLLANPTKLEVWFNLLPPANFEFHGFVVFNALEVTHEQVLSALKNDLLEKDALSVTAKFQELQNKLRVLLKRPHLRLGLAGIPGAQNLLLAHGKKIGQSFILNEACRNACANTAGSIYEHAVKHRELVVIDDLSRHPSPTQIELEILKQGVKSIFIAPLYYENRLMGLLELGSPHAGDLNALKAFKLKEVLALFSIAVKRSLDELNDRIEAVIKAQCTAIHPAVEWRFRQAAVKYLRDHNEGAGTMEPIVFKEVYPLYGLSDIRGSSTIRNNAIRDDLIEQLRMAREIILLAHRQKSLPYLSQLNHRIGQQLYKIEEGLASGDEVSTLEFLRWEVEPHFNHLQTFGEAVAQKIGFYQSELNPLVGLVYRKRKDYEESVAALNETICNFIDAEQERAQAMFPHYFEKYKSDGIEHGIYIGASLVEDGRFDQLYLKNIRLWQLMLLCGVARQAEKLKPQLKIPLELAHLVLVQNQPLSIRFRYDEKKFDVDGTYNVRYEIMKKRIDKAIVKGTEERLTQPRKIAIVYSQAREAAEYREYIDYLQSSGYLTEEVEELELEDLQGIHGLRALRVTVNLHASFIKPPKQKVPENAAAIKEMAEAMV